MDNNSYEQIGMQMKRIRIEHGWTQQQVCDAWPRAEGSTVAAIDRTVYAKYESGKLTPSDERIEQFASIFKIAPDALRQLYQKTAIVIPDTSAFLNNSMLIEMLLEDYDQIVIASTVQFELSGMKNARGALSAEAKVNKKKASQIIGKINELFEQQEEAMRNDKKIKAKLRKEDSESLDLAGDSRISQSDRKLIALAQMLKKKTSRRVYILHYDKDIPFFSDDTISNIKLKDYLMKRRKTPNGYQIILDFDEEFDNLSAYEKVFETLNKDAIDAYLPNGMTLLISCINCNSPDRIMQRGGRIIPERLIKQKVRFLIAHGVDLDKTDCNRYCHTPLEHCISLNPKDHGHYPFDIFRMLLESGADYSKGSIDETKKRDLRISEKNEGNTPLMKACWEGKRKFVYELLKMPDLSINQQDCNGYTALIKCAVRRYKRKEEGKPCDFYEELYQLLIQNGADTRIRDRNNRTAQDWWDLGNQLDKKED